MLYKHYKIVSLFLLCLYLSSCVLAESFNSGGSTSWLEEGKDAAKQLLSNFIDRDDGDFQNLEVDAQPQILRSIDGVYKLSLCFFREHEMSEKSENKIQKNRSISPDPSFLNNPANAPRMDNEGGRNYSGVCSLKPETGMCRASFTAYYYNPARDDCLPFVYGGCGGNDNKFRSREDCFEKCKTPNKNIIFPERLVGF
ncbi:hypothetical protein Yalta_023 [Yalta virus]|nr:hypothetical protein Yalta_023 [Yalta virus]